MRKVAYFLLVTLLLASCSSTTKQTFPEAPNDTSTLEWTSCHDYFQCATMQVPIDYADKSLGTFDIAVIRYRDPKQHDRLGSLLVNPGGPGVSGVQYALDAQYIVDPDVLDRYDIVGFDPRGIGSSTAIHCLSDAELDASFATDPKPDNDAEFATAIADTQDFVNKCVANTPHLADFTSEQTARDMDLLRKALGEKELDYLGFSYGTYLGTLYAQLFPDTVGRFVLDGAVDPSLTIEKQSLVQAVAFDKALDNFIADCHTHKSCPLPANTTGQFFTELFDLVSRSPLTVGDRTITEGLVVTGTASALYDDVSGWPMLRTAIAQALLGDGTTFAKLADQYNGRNSDGTYADNENDANVIIECLDWPHTPTNEEIRANVEQFKKAAPVFGPYVAFSGITCNILNEAITARPAINHKVSFNTANPVLIIGTTQDPATPYAWAQSLSAYIHNSHLITLKGEGHTGYGRGSACTDGAVDSYLLTGHAPTKNLICTH